jgi:hypothetical protein
MTYTGRVRQGVVVLEGNPPLEDGTFVRVEVEAPPQEPPVGSAAAVLRHAGAWASECEEVDRLLEELRQSKQDELRAQQSRPDPSL